jgi:hypothetical protein
VQVGVTGAVVVEVTRQLLSVQVAVVIVVREVVEAVNRRVECVIAVGGEGGAAGEVQSLDGGAAYAPHVLQHREAINTHATGAARLTCKRIYTVTRTYQLGSRIAMQTRGRLDLQRVHASNQKP